MRSSRDRNMRSTGASSGRRRNIHGWLLGWLTAGLLAWSCALIVAQFDYRSRSASAYRRLWSDLTWAINDFVDFRFPLEGADAPGRGQNPSEAYRVVLLDRTGQLGIEPWQFWRSFRPWIFRAHRGPFLLGEFDDPGRAWLLSRAFRWMGGVSPYLILWLAALTALPAVAWCVAELWNSGRPTGALVFGLLTASSPFIAEVLTLPRYAVGFYLAACLLLIGLLLHVALRRELGWHRLLLGFGFTGAGLALCVACRSSSVFILAAAAIAAPLWLVGARGVRLVVAAGLAGLLVLPTVLTKPVRHHDVWQPLWEGLGDFDRIKGHAWSDPVALEVARRGGAPALWTTESERVFRRLTLNDIGAEPWWYASILGKRVLATCLQWKLWPFGPIDGLHMRRASSENEGFIDKYYGYTTTVDHVGFGTSAWEIPILIWPFLTVLLLAHPSLARTADPETRARWRAENMVVAAAALSLLALPVLITTAGAQETQSFVLVYFLAAAFLTERIVAGVRGR